MIQVLLVEDDLSIVRSLTEFLESEGFSVRQVPGQADAVNLAKSEGFDLILMDVSLHDGNGFAACAAIKAFSDVPVIFLTASGDEGSTVAGFELGADDYIAKPFGMAELVARVRTRLRRRGVKGTVNRFEAGDLVLDHRAHTVTVGGEKVALTLKEYDLLHYLMENRGTAFSREQLLNRIWDYSYEGGSRTVDVHIQTLRAKLGRCGEMIETVRGVGYRFGGK